MNILGMHFGHDGSACVVKEGRLVAALASERLTRQKKSGGVQDYVLDAVLETAGVTLDEIDAIALTDWYSPWSHGTIEMRAVNRVPTDQTGFPYSVGDIVHDTWDRIWDDEVIELSGHLRGKTFPVYNVGHQKAHCASAYYTSPFHDAWCVSMDSSGAKPKNNFMTARGKGNCLDWVDTKCCMVGVAYGHVCEKLGIGSQMYKAGSLMALAGYGKVTARILMNTDLYLPGGFVRQDGEYHRWVHKVWNDLSGGREFTPADSDCDQARDIAAGIQHIFEEAILKAVGAVPDDGCRNLCLSGGSFLNCNANSRVLRDSRFENIHLFPACTDDGCPVGAALYVAHHIHDEPRYQYTNKDLAYLGLKRTNRATDYQRVAEALAEGKVVAWFQGRSEYGPRALGNRSILADPRKAEMREKINAGIKHREWYRPLSPSIQREYSEGWFDFLGESPYMLFTAKCRCPEEVPAVVHVDGTSRMQTVKREDNPHYYDLLDAFCNLTGVPMLLNTSLNVDGQPILETQEDAMQFWENTSVDMMVLDGKVWER